MSVKTASFLFQHSWELAHDELDIRLGHRGRERLESLLLSLLRDGYGHFLLVPEPGLAMEALALFHYFKKVHGFTLECVIPFEEQHVAWPLTIQETYFELLGNCDRETMIQRQFSLDCHQKVGRFLMTAAEHHTVVWNGKAGDAGDFVQLLQKKELSYLVMRPAELMR